MYVYISDLLIFCCSEIDICILFMFRTCLRRAHVHRLCAQYVVSFTCVATELHTLSANKRLNCMFALETTTATADSVTAAADALTSL